MTVALTAARGVLDVDLGNSALKYRYAGVSGRANYAAADPATDALPDFVLPDADIAAVSRVRVSSVLGARRDATFSEMVRQRWGVDCEFARSVVALGGVQNGYTDPSALGVDRWLAVVAAFQRVNGPVLVVDLGTAATLDYVSGDGEHLGGFIVPGAQLMRRSLLQETAAIRFAATEQLSDLSPGKQTRDAVERGVLLSLVQLISAELERFDKLCDHNSRLLMCGGDAERVSAHLQCDHEVVADLVLDGLAWALPND